MGMSSVTLRLEARRHSVYNGTQKIICSTEITFVRIDGDGEAVPIPNHIREEWERNNKKTYIDGEDHDRQNG